MDVDFYRLDRAVQDRFADATRGVGVPAPILRQPPPSGASGYWALSAVVVAVGLALGLCFGFGDLQSPLALVPLPHALGYGGLVAVVAFCVLRFLAARSARERIPYEPGLYLFPAGVFDARSEPIRVFRHPDLREVAAVDPRRVRVRAESGEFVFDVPEGQGAADIVAQLAVAREQYPVAYGSENPRELALLDPMVDSGFASPFSSTLKLAKDDPAWARFALFIALGIGAVVGPALWRGRNLLSERRIFQAAVARGDVAGFRAYLARGGQRSEVSEVLLPRAELAAVAGGKAVEALEAFAASHRPSKIQNEIDQALQRAVLEELDAAIQVGTVTALREFAQQRSAYPFILPKVEAATIALYKRELERFSRGKSPQALGLYERLLGHTKTTGKPQLELRFVRKIPNSANQADEQVKLSAYFMGKQSIPSQYFVGDYARAREDQAAERLKKIVAADFPADMLTVEQSPTVTEGDPPPPGDSPRLMIEYAPEMAGGYMSPKPRGVFVGVGMMFKATFNVPGGPPLEFKLSQWRTPNPLNMSAPGTGVADVYEKMAAEAFDKFLKGFAAFLGTSAT